MKRSSPEDFSVLMVANLPPPKNGLSIVNSWVCNVIKEEGIKFKIIDTTARSKSLLFLLTRFVKYVYAILIVSTKINYRVLYLPLGHGLSLLPQASMVLVARIKGKRILLHHHSYIPITTQNSLVRILHIKVFSKAEAIFLSEKMRNEYENRFGSSRMNWVVKNADVAYSRISSSSLRNLDAYSNLIQLTHASNLSVAKGALIVTQTMAELLSRFERVRCNILGPVKDFRILEKLVDLHQRFPTRFNHTSNYDSTLLSKVLLETDFFLFPSNYSNEASPLVVLEAQSAGVTVIASNIGTIETEIVAPGCSVNLSKWIETVTDRIEEVNSWPNKTFSEYKRSSKLKIQSEMEILSIRSRVDMISALLNRGHV